MDKIYDIRCLRLRMGWTASDLARRLGVSPSDVSLWEESHKTPSDSDMLTRIEFLFRQADLCCEEIHNTPLAESLLQDSRQTQIDFDHVKAHSV